MGRIGNGFLLGKDKKEDVPCRFCGKRWSLVLGVLFPSPSLQHVRELLEFAHLMFF